MSVITIDLDDFVSRAKDIITNLKHDEEVIITSNNQPVAKLTAGSPSTVIETARPKQRQGGQSDSIVWISPDFDEPLELQPKRRRAGTAEGEVWMSPDFDEPLDDFKEYMP